MPRLSSGSGERCVAAAGTGRANHAIARSKPANALSRPAAPRTDGLPGSRRLDRRRQRRLRCTPSGGPRSDPRGWLACAPQRARGALGPPRQLHRLTPTAPEGLKPARALSLTAGDAARIKPTSEGSKIAMAHQLVVHCKRAAHDVYIGRPYGGEVPPPGIHLQGAIQAGLRTGASGAPSKRIPTARRLRAPNRRRAQSVE